MATGMGSLGLGRGQVLGLELGKRMEKGRVPQVLSGANGARIKENSATVRHGGPGAAR